MIRQMGRGGGVSPHLFLSLLEITAKYATAWFGVSITGLVLVGGSDLQSLRWTKTEMRPDHMMWEVDKIVTEHSWDNDQPQCASQSGDL